MKNNNENFDCFVVYKSLDPTYPYWIIKGRYDVEDEIISCDEAIHYGDVVNNIIEEIIKHSTFGNTFCTVSSLSDNSDCQNGITIYSDCWLTHDKLIEVLNIFNGVYSMSETAKTKYKSREISKKDYDIIYPRYQKLKDIGNLVHYADSLEINFIFDWLLTGKLLPTRSYEEIISNGEDIVDDNGKKYRKYIIYGESELYALDLHEILFGTTIMQNYIICSNCNTIFTNKNKNTRYCALCNTNERKKERKQRSRHNNEISVLYDKIDHKYRYKWEWEESTEIYKEWTEFREEYFHRKKEYNDINDSETEAKIAAKADFISWLESHLNKDIKEKSHGKTDEKS